MTPEALSAVRAMLVTFEQNRPYMYLDPGGVVTVGIGIALFDRSDAFVLGGESACDNWDFVHALPAGMVDVWYSRQSGWRGQPDALEALFERRLAKTEADLLAQFPDLADWPVPAQVTTYDVAWNCGSELLHHWPHLSAALKAHDWQEASEQCATRGGPAMRNDARKAAFLSCLTSAAPSA